MFFLFSLCEVAVGFESHDLRSMSRARGAVCGEESITFEIKIINKKIIPRAVGVHSANGGILRNS